MKINDPRDSLGVRWKHPRGLWTMARPIPSMAFWRLWLLAAISLLFLQRGGGVVSSGPWTDFIWVAGMCCREWSLLFREGVIVFFFRKMGDVSGRGASYFMLKVGLRVFFKPGYFGIFGWYSGFYPWKNRYTIWIYKIQNTLLSIVLVYRFNPPKLFGLPNAEEWIQI